MTALRTQRSLAAAKALFGGQLQTMTNAIGEFLVEGIFVGGFDLWATDPASGLGGFNSGSVDFNGDVADVTVTLRPAGAIQGFVFEEDSTTPVPGAEVSLSPSGRTTSTDASGFYLYEFVTLGTYRVDGTNPPNGDRGRTSGVQLAIADEVVDADVVLNGVGTVAATVESFGGTPVADVQVTLSSLTQFGGNQSGLTDASGVVDFDNVLAGNFSISAFDPIDMLGGSLDSNLQPGETLAVTVNLEPAGNIVGTVFESDGTMPAPNIRVTLTPLGLQRVTSVDGAYRFDMVPIARSPYRVVATELTGGERARAQGLVVTGDGEEIVQDLVMLGDGRVEGTVFNEDGSPAGSASVQLNPGPPGFRSQFTTTSAAGTYALDDVVIGNFRVTATTSAPRASGFQDSTVTADGELVVVDVDLVENVLPPPPPPPDGPIPPGQPGGPPLPIVTRPLDANNFAYPISSIGTVQDGTRSAFRGDAGTNRGAGRLTLIEGGVETEFDGGIGSLEDGGEELAIAGTGPCGLDVTRKVFVPGDGYFARYLEVLENPTGVDCTLDVQVETFFSFGSLRLPGFAAITQPLGVISTSSSDDTLNAFDQWVTVDDAEDVDPFLSSNKPSIAQVFDGDTGAIGVAAAVFGVSFTPEFNFTTLRWEDVLVPAGSAVAILHFVSQQTTREAAGESANRLVQLPPEAIAGLSPAERSQVLNFDVPGDGSSLLAALPRLDGRIEGTVFEGDGVSIVRSARVFFRSTNPIFGRTYFTHSNLDGNFALQSVPGGAGTGLAIPRSLFTLDSNHPLTSVAAPTAVGGFGSEPLTTQDVVFGDSGLVFGEITNADGFVVSSGSVTISRGRLPGTPHDQHLDLRNLRLWRRTARELRTLGLRSEPRRDGRQRSELGQRGGGRRHRGERAAPRQRGSRRCGAQWRRLPGPPSAGQARGRGLPQNHPDRYRRAVRVPGRAGGELLGASRRARHADLEHRAGRGRRRRPDRSGHRPDRRGQRAGRGGALGRRSGLRWHRPHHPRSNQSELPWRRRHRCRRSADHSERSPGWVHGSGLQPTEPGLLLRRLRHDDRSRLRRAGARGGGGRRAPDRGDHLASRGSCVHGGQCIRRERGCRRRPRGEPGRVLRGRPADQVRLLRPLLCKPRHAGYL